MDPARRAGWVRLNVGGRIFSTTRATLCRVPESMLAAMFREDSPMEPSHIDETGAYMLDLDPDYFAPILNYLRFDKLVIDQSICHSGILETARFLQLTDIVCALESGSVDASHLQYVEISFIPSSGLTTVGGAIELCAKDLTANLGFVRYGDSFQKAGQHSLLVLNTLASRGWTLAVTHPNSIHLMSYRVTPAPPRMEKRVLSSLHLSDPLSTRASIADGRELLEQVKKQGGSGNSLQNSIPASASTTGSGRKLLP